MSGIYIPGMGAPKDCPMCPLSYWTWGGVFRGCNIVSGKRYAMDDPEYANSNKRPEWCPLVPVPEHGRLIDADALTTQMARNLWSIEDKAEKELGFNETLRRGMQYGHAVCVDAVNAAPTIIPADKEGE